ncbi:hypothetical protein D9Q98_000568 [Chlorella vulgaris]|uniref:J domain-containing protein n=1 Tax=Chlorella vulgaris TaxID=3077 RepID=A0A9D4Z1Y2_CHLVU|nr:hypothetical protein D9Q98_000568 [Chlorella vulgaris]
MVQIEGKTLYEALGVTKDANQADIRKAYMKLALQLHPDKNPGDEGASAKFQTLQKVYSILSDADKRKVYDQTGSVEDSEELAGQQFNDLYNYYRSMFAKVTDHDLELFHDSYHGSEEERGELLRYYEQHKGDMRKVFEWVMCSNEAADSHRFMDLLAAAIEAKEVPSFPKYTSWAKKVAKKPRPTAATAAAAAGKGKRKQTQQEDAETALVAQIRSRQQGGRLAVAPSGVLGRLMAEVESGMPSEEEFQAAGRRLQQKKGGSSKQKAATPASAAAGSKRAKK